MNLTDPATFWAKVDVRSPDECWPWRQSLNDDGYGQAWVGPARGGYMTKAHRLALLLSGVFVPEDKMALHRCDNPPCCNPAHLYVGTNADNMRDFWARTSKPRGVPQVVIDAAAAKRRAITHCPRGHPYDEENTYRYNDGRRACRTCIRVNGKRNRALRQSRGVADLTNYDRARDERHEAELERREG